MARKDSHWYTTTGEPRYEVIGKTTGKARPVTLRDARENGWVPGVTTVLKILHKQGLEDWKIEQSVLACLTTPQKKDEPLDAFIERVLHVEKIQDQETTLARDKGTEIHAALEDYWQGKDLPEDLLPWIMPAATALGSYGELVASEIILVGDGYAGKCDLILRNADFYWVWDYKTTKKLPDPAKGGAWPEHRLQLSAYARAFMDKVGELDSGKIRTGNIYISSIEEGKFSICEHASNWMKTYTQGFEPLVTHWQWANAYAPPPTIGKLKAPPKAPDHLAEPQTLPGVTEAKPEPKTPSAPRPLPTPEKPTIQGKKVVWSSSEQDN